MLFFLSLFGRVCDYILKSISRIFLTLCITILSAGTSSFLYYYLDMPSVYHNTLSGFARIISRIIMAILPVGRANSYQGPWPHYNPIVKFISEMMPTQSGPTYICKINLNPNIFEQTILSVWQFFGNQSLDTYPLFIFIHLITCGMVIVFASSRLKRNYKLYYGLSNYKPKHQLLPNWSKIIMLSALLSIIWPSVTKIIWHTWWEYYVLVDLKYTIVLTHARNGFRAGAAFNPYGDGVARGWFGYYGVFAGVFLSYVLTVWWSAKFVIDRAVKREAAVIGSAGSSDGVEGPGSGIGRDGVDDTILLTIAHRGRRWIWRVGIGLLILMLYGWPLVVGWVGRILPDDIWMKLVPY